MNIKQLMIKSVCITFACFSFFCVAEDIELYVNHKVELDEKPRVLLVFDTSGSMDWSVVNGDNQTCYMKYNVGKDKGKGKGKGGQERLVGDGVWQPGAAVGA